MEPKKTRLSGGEFNAILKQVFPYNEKDREYVKQKFQQVVLDGITEFDLRQELGKMRFDTKDVIDNFEADKIQKQFLDKLGK